MIRSVIFIVFISIALTQCSPPSAKNPPKLTKTIKINAAAGKPFGNGHNFAASFDALKPIIEQISPDYEEIKYKFGKRVEGDGLIGAYVEINVFDAEKDVEVIYGYPYTGKGQFKVSYVEVYVIQVIKKNIIIILNKKALKLNNVEFRRHGMEMLKFRKVELVRKKLR